MRDAQTTGLLDMLFCCVWGRLLPVPQAPSLLLPLRLGRPCPWVWAAGREGKWSVQSPGCGRRVAGQTPAGLCVFGNRLWQSCALCTVTPERRCLLCLSHRIDPDQSLPIGNGGCDRENEHAAWPMRDADEIWLGVVTGELTIAPHF